MSHMYLVKDMPRGNGCLKIINNANDELSVAFDDSAGAFNELSRSDMMLFPNSSTCMRDGTDLGYGDPENLLLALANHLGYTVTKNP